jgi:competence protein ComEC
MFGDIIKSIKKISLLIFDLSGCAAIWQKVRPLASNEQRKPASTIVIWGVSIYLGAFAIASQRFENQLDRIENRVNAVIAQGSIELVPSSQLLTTASKPNILEITSLWDSLFGEKIHDDDAIGLLRELVVSKKMALKDKNLRKINLENSNMQYANLYRTQLFQAKISNADFTSANFSLAELGSISAIETNFTDAILREAYLDNADLRNAKFIFADLSFANLTNANIEGADFSGAYLGGATWIDGKICSDKSYGKCISESSNGRQQVLSKEKLEVTVIDVGAGLSVLIKVPSHPFAHYILYDVGSFRSRSVKKVLNNMLPIGSKIDMMIFSHGDADHIGEATSILKDYRIEKVLRTGLERRGVKTWGETHDLIRSKQRYKEIEDLNLRYVDIEAGWNVSFGEAKITLLSGGYKSPGKWDATLNRVNEKRNANSLVIKVEYNGSTILLSGDSIGRIRGSSENSLPILTEGFLVKHAKERPIKSNVLVAPNHGSDLSSSIGFIREVDPEWVIFSAGKRHKHPRNETIERYKKMGVKTSKILSTNNCLLEGKAYAPGQNHIRIEVDRAKNIDVFYVDPSICN